MNQSGQKGINVFYSNVAPKRRIRPAFPGAWECRCGRTNAKHLTACWECKAPRPDC